MPQLVEARYTGGRGLKGATVRLEVTVYVDGAATTATGTPTYTVTRADGTALVTAQNATAAAAGVYYYDLTPAQAVRVDKLTVVLAGTWVSAAQTFTFETEIVGEPLFTLSEARAFDASALVTAATYPAATILEARDQITDQLEEWTWVSWIGRHARYDLAGSGTSRLTVSHHAIQNLIAASIDNAAQTVSDVAVARFAPLLEHKTTIWASPSTSDPLNVTVEYEHGRRGRPQGVSRIALLLLRDRLVKSDIPDSAIQYQGDKGAMQLVREGGPMHNVTRIPEVNAWIAANRLIPVS